tara:strand:- start:147 stop:743 length:597 start_codon:yes stop_codon:yes gene_type:complete
MIKNIMFFVFFTNAIFCFSQIKVFEQKSSNVSIVGKISHTGAIQRSGLSRKLPVVDPLRYLGDLDLNQYKKIRKGANDVFKTIGIRNMAVLKNEEFSSTLLFLEDKDEYLLTFKNSNYNYQNESIWLSKQTKEELYQLIVSELKKRPKYKNIEVILNDNVVLLISINRRKISFNLWDGYEWVQSYWYRLFKIENLFGN